MRKFDLDLKFEITKIITLQNNKNLSITIFHSVKN